MKICHQKSTIQEKVLTVFQRETGLKRLKKMQEATGINATRIWRIFTGQPMKINELEIFLKLSGQKRQIYVNTKGIEFHEVNL